MAVSRQREYLADATGALTTRYPEGLASALEKIKKTGSVAKHQNTATAHLFFVNPLKKGQSDRPLQHPSADRRPHQTSTRYGHPRLTVSRISSYNRTWQKNLKSKNRQKTKPTA